MEPKCSKCQDTGRIRSGPIPQRAQGYLEIYCDCKWGDAAYASEKLGQQLMDYARY